MDDVENMDRDQRYGFINLYLRSEGLTLTERIQFIKGLTYDEHTSLVKLGMDLEPE